MNYIQHPFGPLFNEESRVLILGSFPSVKSREQNFFYGHPQNRFWKVTAALLNEPLPQSIPEKRKMLLAHHIALWDVIAKCEISATGVNHMNCTAVILNRRPDARRFVFRLPARRTRSGILKDLQKPGR